MNESTTSCVWSDELLSTTKTSQSVPSGMLETAMLSRASGKRLQRLNVHKITVTSMRFQLLPGQDPFVRQQLGLHLCRPVMVPRPRALKSICRRDTASSESFIDNVRCGLAEQHRNNEASQAQGRGVYDARIAARQHWSICSLDRQKSAAQPLPYGQPD
jgi:hypothetical protein